MRQKLRLRKSRLLERRCWESEMKMQKKNVWKLTEKKRKRLKTVYIRIKGGK